MEKSKYNSLQEFRFNDVEAYNSVCAKKKLKEMCERFGWKLYKRLYEVSTIEECVELGKKYKIISASTWTNKHKEIGKKEGKKLPSTPWTTFNLEGGKAMFTQLLGGFTRVYDVSTIEECVVLGKKYKITSAREWTAKHKEIGKKEGKKLPSNPWITFNLEGGYAKFSELLGCDRFFFDVSSNDECVVLGKKYKIKSAREWTAKYKEIGKKEGKKLPSEPWITFNLKGGYDKFSELLEYVINNFDVSTIEECVVLGKKYKITSASTWRKKNKEIGKKEGKRLPNNPWSIFNLDGGEVEFSVLLRRDSISSIGGYIELGKKYKITSASMWRRKSKEIGKKEGKKLLYEPWISFGLEGGGIQFSELLNSNKKT